eukprot:m.265088 g.265088  ORF g.265088 m.265088 type:complete len:338 (-) comp59816_c0_seq1:81-1094(-)
MSVLVPLLALALIHHSAVTNSTVFQFGRNDFLGVIAIPKTGTRSLEIFLERHLPLTIPAPGCLYCISGTKLSSATPPSATWPKSTALLQPDVDPLTNTRVNPDLFLVHVNYEEMLADWRAQQQHMSLEGLPQGHLFTTTMLRDPFERVASEFFFGIQFELRDKWSTPQAWRRQFWGQKDYSDTQLLSLQSPPPAFNGSRLEFFASMSWVAAHNRQTRFLAGISNPDIKITRAILEKAKRNLANIDVVGTLDDSEKYFLDLSCAFRSTFDHAPPTSRATRFDATTTTIVSNHNTKGQSKSFSMDYKDSIYEHSWADLELFAYARRLILEKRRKRVCEL